MPLFRLPRFVLPPPVEVLTALFNNLPILLHDTWITDRETVAAFFLGIVVAVPLAILITTSAPLRNGIYPFLLLGILLFTLVALAEKVLCPWHDKG